MRIIAYTFLLLFVIAERCPAQSFSLYYHDVELPPDTLIVRAGTTDSLDLTTFFTIRNNSSAEKQVQEKKTEISMVPGTACSLCWAGYCYPKEVFQTDYPLVLAPGASETSCFAHFITSGTAGTSIVRWTYFDQDNVEDSVSVVIRYITYPMAVENRDATRLLVSPNPADSEVRFSFDPPSGSEWELRLRTLSGAIVFQCSNPGTDGILKINTSGFANGVYLYTVKSKGTLTGSGKLLVLHH